MNERYGVNTDLRYGSRLTLPDPPISSRTLRSPLTVGGTVLLTSDTAYFIYVGQTVVAGTPKYVEFYLTTGGAGVQTSEVGLFSTTGPPNKASKSLTKIVATGTVDSELVGTDVKRNTAAFSTVVAAGTYLWAGIRSAVTITQPTLRGIQDDWGQGYVLLTATAGALTGTGPWTGALAASSSQTNGPTLRVVYD